MSFLRSQLTILGLEPMINRATLSFYPQNHTTRVWYFCNPSSAAPMYSGIFSAATAWCCKVLTLQHWRFLTMAHPQLTLLYKLNHRLLYAVVWMLCYDLTRRYWRSMIYSWSIENIPTTVNNVQTLYQIFYIRSTYQPPQSTLVAIIKVPFSQK